MRSTSSLNASLALAFAVSAGVVLSAPFLGQLRAYLRAAFPGHFVTIVGVSVAVAILGALALALARIRHARAIRYAVIAGAAAVAIAYTLVTQTGIPEVDVVERVHFIEYGAIAFLFYRAFRPLGDLSAFILPMLAGLMVGTFDEWLQWFIPNRVGEARDVFLNLIAIGCGLAFGAALEPPSHFRFALPPRSRRLVTFAGVAALLVFAAFVNAVHLGYFLVDAEIGAFRSHYSPEELQQLASNRLAGWRVEPPTVLKRLSREDQYLDEGLWHIRERNRRWDAGDYDVALRENDVLERYFSPVIDTKSYAAPELSRWPPEQKADARQRAQGGITFISEAEPYPILATPRWQFWSVVMTFSAALLLLGLKSKEGGSRDQDPPSTNHEPRTTNLT